MGIKSRDWEKVGNYITEIKSLGLSLKDGAKHFGLNVADLYEYNKRFKNGVPRSIGKVKNNEKLGDYIRQIQELGLSLVEGAHRFGLDVKALYRYNHAKRLKEKKEQSNLVTSIIASVEDLNKASGDCPNQPEQESSPVSISSTESSPVSVFGLPPGVEELIVNYRREHPEFGYKRIVDYLKSRHFVVITRKKIREVLKAHGLTDTLDSSFDKSEDEEKPKGTRRFEASYPRQLYQMDITYVYLPNNAIYYLVIILDDYSRFCVGSELRLDQRGLSMIEVLHRAIERYGKPDKLLTDQGSCFYSWSRNQTLFSRYLDDMKIEHIVADPHSPQTLGKVERLNQTIQRELLNRRQFSSYEEASQSISEYFHQYNYSRPHQGIQGALPSSRFHGVIGETSRIESQLCGHGIDFSRGYLVFKMYEHSISIVSSKEGVQVFLDGHLLEPKSKSGTVKSI